MSVASHNVQAKGAAVLAVRLIDLLCVLLLLCVHINDIIHIGGYNENKY